MYDCTTLQRSPCRDDPAKSSPVETEGPSPPASQCSKVRDAGNNCTASIVAYGAMTRSYQPALQAKARHAERLVLIVQASIETWKGF